MEGIPTAPLRHPLLPRTAVNYLPFPSPSRDAYNIVCPLGRRQLSTSVSSYPHYFTSIGAWKLSSPENLSYTSISRFLNDTDSSGPSLISSPSPIMFSGFGVPNDVRIAPASTTGPWAAVHFIRSHRSRSFSHQPRTSPDFRLRFLCLDRLDSGAFVPPRCNSFGTWIDPGETNAVNQEINK